MTTRFITNHFSGRDVLVVLGGFMSVCGFGLLLVQKSRVVSMESPGELVGALAPIVLGCGDGLINLQVSWTGRWPVVTWLNVPVDLPLCCY